MKPHRVSASLLPTVVCAWCDGVVKKRGKKVSHGICPSCRERHFGKSRPAASVFGLLQGPRTA
jgi:hypothetical protein